MLMSLHLSCDPASCPLFKALQTTHILTVENLHVLVRFPFATTEMLSVKERDCHFPIIVS